MITYAGRTDQGMVRKNNEDNYAVVQLDNGCVFAIVADGMGGHNAGEIASSTAVEQAVAYVQSHQDLPGETLLINAIKTANYEVFRDASQKPECNNMGTTVTAALITEDEIVFSNVGDSRGYLYSSALEQVTVDHSYVQQLIAEGFITQQEAEDHPQKNYITRAIGFDDNVEVDLFRRAWNSGDRLLLCSDGLMKHVSFDEIAKILSTLKTPEFACESFVTLTNGRGGSDNVTVVAVYNN